MNAAAGRSPDSHPLPSYSEVIAIIKRGGLIFLAAALSTWGLPVLVSVAFVRVRADWFAAGNRRDPRSVGLLPTIFGRSLLAPIADRIPYKYVLIAANPLRGGPGGVELVTAGGADGALWVLFALLFLIELVGGPAIASSQILMTDLFSDRRLYARALGLSTMSSQINQAIGIGIGGLVVAAVGTSVALLVRPRDYPGFGSGHRRGGQGTGCPRHAVGWHRRVLPRHRRGRRYSLPATGSGSLCLS